MYNKILCRLFGHKLGEWEYVAKDSCEQVRVCSRCGLEEKRQGKHSFGAWEYVADNSCEQVRICERCGLEEKRQGEHSFGAWKYVAKDSCEQVRVCSRCGYKSTAYHHDFGEWRFEAAINGGTRTCRRCGEVEHEYYSHGEEMSRFELWDQGYISDYQYWHHSGKDDSD